MDKITTAECNRVVAILEDSVERLMLLIGRVVRLSLELVDDILV